jgi:hypothetical protein
VDIQACSPLLAPESGEGDADDREGGSVDDDGQGEVRYRCVKLGRKECLKGKALVRGMGLKDRQIGGK